MTNFLKFLISTIFSILYALLLQKHIQSHILNNYKVINKNKMSCNTLCPCISSVEEQYSRILHNMHFDHVIWHHNAFCNISVWQMSLLVFYDTFRPIDMIATEVKGLGAIRAKIGPTSDVDRIFSKMYSPYELFRNKYS